MLQVVFSFIPLFITKNKNPCSCKKRLDIKIHLLLSLNHFIPRCPFYTPCFAFRRTGIHPPYFL